MKLLYYLDYFFIYFFTLPPNHVTFTAVQLYILTPTRGRNGEDAPPCSVEVVLRSHLSLVGVRSVQAKGG